MLNILFRFYASAQVATDLWAPQTDRNNDVYAEPIVPPLSTTGHRKCTAHRHTWSYPETTQGVMISLRRLHIYSTVNTTQLLSSQALEWDSAMSGIYQRSTSERPRQPLYCVSNKTFDDCIIKSDRHFVGILLTKLGWPALDIENDTYRCESRIAWR